MGLSVFITKWLPHTTANRSISIRCIILLLFAWHKDTSSCILGCNVQTVTEDSARKSLSFSSFVAPARFVNSGIIRPSRWCAPYMMPPFHVSFVGGNRDAVSCVWRHSLWEGGIRYICHGKYFETVILIITVQWKSMNQIVFAGCFSRNWYLPASKKPFTWNNISEEETRKAARKQGREATGTGLQILTLQRFRSP